MGSEFYIMLGGVIEAHENRSRQREAAKTAAASVKSAETERAQFGRFEDCGGSYERWASEAKGALQLAVSAKISAEKRFKAIKSEFMGRFGQSAQTAIVEHLPSAFGRQRENEDA